MTWPRAIASMRRMRFSIMAFALGLTACASQALLTPPNGFTQSLGRDHPLSGKIYSNAKQAFVDRAELDAALVHAQFIVLGETHDNRDHHLLQAELLQRVIAAHGPVHVAFEMLDARQGEALASRPPSSPDQLAQRVDWADSGWPDFALYRPVFEVALRAHCAIVAASPSPEAVRASMQGLDPAELRALHLDQPLPAAQEQAAREEIRASHCGHANEPMVDAMERAQSFKDAYMARAMLQSGAPTVLIAGRGHALRGRAVPLYLRRSGARGVLSVGFVDVAQGQDQPSDYDVRDYDFSVFTPRVSDEDPCERFRRQLERMQHGAQGPRS